MGAGWGPEPVGPSAPHDKGRVFEDTADDGIVPFMSEEPVAMPMRVDLYNREGVIVANDEWGFEDE